MIGQDIVVILTVMLIAITAFAIYALVSKYLQQRKAIWMLDNVIAFRAAAKHYAEERKMHPQQYVNLLNIIPPIKELLLMRKRSDFSKMTKNPKLYEDVMNVRLKNMEEND